MNTDYLILDQFKKALQKSSGDDVLNLDDKLDIKFECTIQAFEEAIPQFNYHIAPNKWSYYRIGLLKKGSGDYNCGIYKFKATENTLIIIPPRVINASTNWTKDAEGYVVIFNLDFFLQNRLPHKYIENKKILQPSTKPYIRLTEDQAKKADAIFKTILRERRSNDIHKNELIALKIIELLIFTERVYAETNEPDPDQAILETVKKFSDLVELHFDKQRTVSFYASQLNIHPNYLNSLVKSQTGFTAKESILNRLILEAKYLLQTTPLSIKEIANKLGFEDTNYFTSVFKRTEKINPATYRASSLKT